MQTSDGLRNRIHLLEAKIRRLEQQLAALTLIVEELS